MQRLIDADRFIEKVNKDRQHECYMHSWTANDVLKRLDSYYAPTVLTIPDNPTNGNMIEALFPNCVLDSNFGGAVITSINGETQYWRMKWWNSPYKRGDTDGSNN